MKAFWPFLVLLGASRYFVKGQLFHVLTRLRVPYVTLF